MATAVPVSGGTEIAAAHTAMSGVPVPTGNHGVQPGEARRLARFGSRGREAVTGKVACAGSRAPHPSRRARALRFVAGPGGGAASPGPLRRGPKPVPGPRGFRWCLWWPSVRHLIPGSRWISGAPRKANILSALVAPAVRRRARLSGAIRCQRVPAIGRSRSHRLLADRGSGGQGGAFPPGRRDSKSDALATVVGRNRHLSSCRPVDGAGGGISAGVRAAAGCCSRDCRRHAASSTAGRGARRRHSGGAGP